MSHICHATKCNVPVPPKMLMCLKHWRMVPAPLQRRIWATYVPGQEVRKNPTKAYLEAFHAAVTAVAIKEGHIKLNPCQFPGCHGDSASHIEGCPYSSGDL